MTLTMFYIRGMHKKNEYHANVPAEDEVGAYAVFKHQHAEAVVTEILALFKFESEPQQESVLVTQ